MAKSFKDFRNQKFDDEWEQSDYSRRKEKDMRLKSRRDEKRKKNSGKFASLETKDDD